MAFVRIFGKLSCNSIKISLFNKNVCSNLRFISNTPVLSATLHKTSPPPSSSAQQKIGKRDALDTNFNDPIASFKSKTNLELIRAYFVYLLCSSEYLVENNMKVIT